MSHLELGDGQLERAGLHVARRISNPELHSDERVVEGFAGLRLHRDTNFPLEVNKLRTIRPKKESKQTVPMLKARERSVSLQSEAPLSFQIALIALIVDDVKSDAPAPLSWATRSSDVSLLLMLSLYRVNGSVSKDQTER